MTITKITPNTNQTPEFPIISGEFFIVPNGANRCLTPKEKELAEKIPGNFVFDSIGTIEEERKALFGEDLAYKPFVQIWAHNAPEEGFDSNWTDHGIPTEVLEKAGIKFKMSGWREGLFCHQLPYDFVADKKEGDHVYLKVVDDNGKTAFFDLVCKQKGYRYESRGEFQDVVADVMARGRFEL